MKKKVLLIGSGGREHALAWKLCQSSRLGKLFVAPGNAGTADLYELAEVQNVPIQASDIDKLLAFAGAENIDLTVVGPDDPLALGIVDVFTAHDLPIFGPPKAAARIESSKAFAKALMKAVGVPTAKHAVFGNHGAALSLARHHFFREAAMPLVLKASGLALGKGAYVCQNFHEADRALLELMVHRVHGDAGNEVIAEAYVPGPEVSMHAFCDGISFKSFPAAQDHKPIFDGDRGPNTGGMGTIAPVPWFNHHDMVDERIIAPILSKMREEGYPFKGLLFSGLKVPSAGPMVLEFNARFGDPETQTYMRLLKTDLLDILEACVEGRLGELEIEWHPGFGATIVASAAGYPSPDYRKNSLITGIEGAELVPGVVVFQAGTKYLDEQLITSGGRVLGVSAVGETLRQALDRAYEGMEHIHFEGMHYRKDIGTKSLSMQ